jgi:predicted SAM-dependent methyltransferase
MKQSYIQLGCGLCVPPGWRNFDAGPVLWVQKRTSWLNSMFRRKGFPIYPVDAIEYADVTLGLPVPQQSANGVYCSHVLEHLALAEFRTTIRNVFGYLRPSGIFRMVLPDLEYIVKRYNATEDPSAAIRLMDEIGERNPQHGFRSAMRLLFGRSRHLWMWDFKAIAKELEQAGFVSIRRAYFRDSVDPLRCRRR